MIQINVLEEKIIKIIKLCYWLWNSWQCTCFFCQCACAFFMFALLAFYPNETTDSHRL